MTSSNRLNGLSFAAATAALGIATLTSCTPADVPAPSDESTRFASVDEWIARESIPFSSNEDFGGAVDRMVARLGDRVEVLGFGEALHGGEEHLELRNRVFQRLVAAHGYSAITIEITHSRAQLVNEYIHGRGPASYEQIQEAGFNYGAGLYAANRELVEWMKKYNEDSSHAVKLSLYGTLPSEQGETTESPRRALEAALTYLQSVDAEAAAQQRQITQPLLGKDEDWEGPAAAITKMIMTRLMNPTQSQNAAPDASLQFGLSPRAEALRLAVENLAFDLRVRRPELVAKSDVASYKEALYQVSVARNLLELHAALARGDSLGRLVSIRDAMAADHIVYLTEREGRGKILVHLHNSHLRRTQNKLPWYEFWPTGAHLELLLGNRFAVIGGAVGTSPENFIGAPEEGTIEARLLAQGQDCFLPVGRARALPADELAALPTRSGPTHPFVPYEQLSPQSLADLDGIAFFRTVTHTRGMPAYE